MIICVWPLCLTYDVDFFHSSDDMAIIHAKLATNQPGSKDQFSEFPVPRIPLPGELHSLHNHQDLISKLLDKVVLSSSVGVSPQDSLTTIQAQPQRQPRPSRTKKAPKSQVVQHLTLLGVTVSVTLFQSSRWDNEIN